MMEESTPKDDTQVLREKLEELKKSEERYHKMVEEVEDYAILLLDKDGIVQNWNRGAEKIKGYKAEEIVGKSFSSFYFDEDIKKGLPQQLLSAARETGKAIHEGWRRRKDGSRFWGSVVITALHDSENNVVGFSKVTRDLTERKVAEDRLKDFSQQLEFQNKELEQFAYAASHDMREPLRKIIFYNQFVIQHAEQLDDKAKDFLQRSVNAANRLTKLIDDLLDYSQTISPDESFQATDLNEIVKEIIASHHDLVEQGLLELETQQLPVIRAIPFQVKQLFDNLVNNSIKYRHPDKAVKISVSAEEIKGSEVPVAEADRVITYYKISVADNGTGFEQAYSEKIFEIFQRLSNETGFKGSGIGLAICKKIVQNHHGFIKATSTKGEGAVFEVYLPKE